MRLLSWLTLFVVSSAATQKPTVPQESGSKLTCFQPRKDGGPSPAEIEAALHATNAVANACDIKFQKEDSYSLLSTIGHRAAPGKPQAPVKTQDNSPANTSGKKVPEQKKPEKKPPLKEEPEKKARNRRYLRRKVLRKARPEMGGCLSFTTAPGH